MVVMALARVGREVIFTPERTLFLSLSNESMRHGETYSASNWFGRIKSACWIIFL